ncbi:MAG: hypothetical protein PWQ97_736 [Tepidanaerobacteraceae bacterium]|nr:hypothetical protein [Tepidanaerobacteraceae bacterium]
MKRVLLTILILIAAHFIIFTPLAMAESVTLNEPKDNLMTTSDSVVVSGEALPNSSIYILVNGRSRARLTVGAAGIFLTQVPISGKESIITIRAVQPSGITETVSRRVYKIDGSELPDLESLIQTIKTFLILK